MNQSQLVNSGPGARWWPPHGDPFQVFWDHHRHMNRFLRSTEMAYTLSVSRIRQEGTRLSAPLERLFPPEDVPSESLSRYWPIEAEPRRRSTAPVPVGDFLGDLERDWETLFESVLVRYLGGFEIFLKTWAWHAADTSAGREALASLRRSLETDVRSSPNLRAIVRILPVIQQILTNTPHIYRSREGTAPERPEETGLNCFDVAEMWREVRNLVVHHNRIVHADFLEGTAPTWEIVEADARGDGPAVLRSPVIGQPLPLDLQDVVHCFTTCFRTAEILGQVLSDWGFRS